MLLAGFQLNAVSFQVAACRGGYICCVCVCVCVGGGGGGGEQYLAIGKDLRFHKIIGES